MIEKRFTAIPETVSYKDNLTGERLCPKREKDYYAVLNKMNKLSEENKQLKTECEIYKTENLKLFNALKAMCDVEICEVCKHNEYLVYESMMYPTEYDSRCKKGFRDPGEKYGGVEVQECDDFEVFEDW